MLGCGDPEYAAEAKDPRRCFQIPFPLLRFTWFTIAMETDAPSHSMLPDYRRERPAIRPPTVAVAGTSLVQPNGSVYVIPTLRRNRYQLLTESQFRNSLP